MTCLMVLIFILGAALAVGVFVLKIWLASVVFQWVQRRRDRKISKHKDT